MVDEPLGRKNNNYSANLSFGWFYHGLYLWHPYTNLYYIPMISPYIGLQEISSPQRKTPENPKAFMDLVSSCVTMGATPNKTTCTIELMTSEFVPKEMGFNGISWGRRQI
jgi:hypothetical protein